MLGTLHKNYLVYVNSKWGRRIIVWSSVAIFVCAVIFVAYLDVGGTGGSGSAGSKFITFLILLITIPSLIVFNLALALLWAIAATVAGAFRG